MTRWTSRILLAALAFSMSGCERCQGPSSPLLGDAAPPPDFAHSSTAKKHAVPLPEPVLWDRARKTHDAIDLASLADAVGASGLLDGLERGGENARVALLALPYASGAVIAYRRLAEIALQTSGEDQRRVLSTIQAIALKHRLTMEPEDPEGTVFCAKALQEVSQKSGVEKVNKNLALSTLRLSPFAEILAMPSGSAGKSSPSSAPASSPTP